MTRSASIASWLLFAGLACGGCSKDAPSTVLLTIRSAAELQPDELRLSVFDPASRVVDGQRLPASGAPTLPSTVVLYPATSSGELRLLVRARVGDAVVAEGVTRVELKSGAQVLAEVTLLSGRLADRDGDGVPDDIDRCPDLPNPAQGACSPDAGMDGPAREAGPDGPLPDGDVDLATHDGPPADGHPDLGQDASKDSTPPPPDLGPCGTMLCPLGCNASQQRCNRIAPTGSSVSPTDYSAATNSLSIAPSATLVFNGSSGLVTLGSTTLHPANTPGAANGIVWRPAGGVQGAALFVLDRLVLMPGATARLEGAVPVLIYVRTELTIEGAFHADAAAVKPGAGGSQGGDADGDDGASCGGGEGQGGTQAGGGTVQIEAGGGGGALGGKGGAGGDGFFTSVGTTPGGTGGAVHGAATILLGGCGGGAGGGPDTGGSVVGHGAYGGGGGGALQLVVDGKLTISGVVTANGAGGGGGIHGSGGGGGGSGGMLFFEAQEVRIDPGAFVAATGGGGGAGSELLLSSNVSDGQDGQASAIGAAGGVGTNFGGSGGPGGADSANGEDGQVEANGGGGGGGAGRIRIHAPQLSGLGNRSAPQATTSPNVQVW